MRPGSEFSVQITLNIIHLFHCQYKYIYEKEIDISTRAVYCITSHQCNVHFEQTLENGDSSLTSVIAKVLKMDPRYTFISFGQVTKVNHVRFYCHIFHGYILLLSEC